MAHRILQKSLVTIVVDTQKPIDTKYQNIPTMTQHLENKRILLVARSDKEDQPSPFKFQQTTFVAPDDFLLILKVLCFSVDPVMRVWMSGAETYFPPAQLNQPFHTFGVAQVIDSKTSLYKKGDYVFGNTSCSQYFAVTDEKRLRTMLYIPVELMAGFSPEEFTYLTNNGLTAYEGVDIMGVKAGEMVVVSTAAGATGLLACQILRYRGVKVIGLTSQKKVGTIEKYCDVVVDYKDQKKLNEVLKTYNFKYYFDNVGEWLLDLIIKYIQPNGVISLCGATANYRSFKERTGLRNYQAIISKRLILKGFNFSMAFGKIFQAFDHLREMKKEGKLDLYIDKIKIQEFPEGFNRLMRGKNVGKIIVSQPPSPKL